MIKSPGDVHDTRSNDDRCHLHVKDSYRLAGLIRWVSAVRRRAGPGVRTLGRVRVSRQGR